MLAVEHRDDDRGVGVGVTAANGIERRHLETRIRGVEHEFADAVGRHLVAPRGTVDAELVDAVGSREHERVHVSQSVQHLGHHRRKAPVRNADQLVADTRGIGERSEHVEHGADAELATHRDHVTERRMKVGRVQEPDAGLLDAAAHAFRGKRDDDAEGLEHVGAAAA